MTPSQEAREGYPLLPEPAMEDVPSELWGQNVTYPALYTAEQMRSYVDADRKARQQDASDLEEQPPQGAAEALEDAAIVCERRDEFGHTHRDVAANVRSIGTAVRRVVDEAVTGECARPGYAWVPLEALTELSEACTQSSGSPTPILGYMVHTGDTSKAALFNTSQRADAEDAARRWKASITALTVCHGSPVPQAPQETPNALWDEIMSYAEGQKMPSEARLKEWAWQVRRLAASPQGAEPTDAMREVLQRCVAGIDHLSALARLWEPDHSSGSDRRGWVLAQDARDDARKLLAASPLPTPQEPAAEPLPNLDDLRDLIFNPCLDAGIDLHKHLERVFAEIGRLRQVEARRQHGKVIGGLQHYAAPAPVPEPELGASCPATALDASAGTRDAASAPCSLPQFITFTGADEFTDIDRMAALSRKYPIEWGILFSPKRQGEGRYPPHSFVQKLLDRGCFHLSAHLCGGHARSALAGIDPLGLSQFDRIQINTTEPNIDIAALRKWAEGLGARAILQCRGSEFPKTAAVAWLFDQSGGRGIEPGAWPKSHATAQCGYAGGIGPDNVRDVLARIDSTDFWIDMESKVRDANDRFDLDAVERVCRLVWPQSAPEVPRDQQAPSERSAPAPDSTP